MASFGQSTDSDGFNGRVVKIKRTTKVVRGGRKFSFGAVTVVGDGKGKIGIGFGKATEVSIAVNKAMENARKNMHKIKLKGNTIQYQIVSRHGASKVFMKPASEGTGIIAGGAMRPVFEVLGVENVLAKIIGSTNAVNVVRATLNGLMEMNAPAAIAAKRGITVEEMMAE